MPAKNKTPNASTPKEITDYEIRVKAMTLAIQHSKNSSRETLYRHAENIYNFLNGKPFVKNSEV